MGKDVFSRKRLLNLQGGLICCPPQTRDFSRE